MNSARTPLIQKITSKGSVITPFEAIHLRYLSRKGILNKLMDVERESNPYIAAQEMRGPLSQSALDFIVSNVARENPDSYRAYNYAYEHILDQDKNSERLGYKGLVLLTQLRLIRCEYCSVKDVEDLASILDFQSFSYLHQKKVSHKEVLSTLGNTFRYFIKEVDIILTFNYFLKQLIDLEDLSCLRQMKMWLNSGSDDVFEHPKSLNGAHLCCTAENIEFLLKENHHDYVESVKRNLKDLPASFSDDSLQYVQNIINTTVTSASEA